MHGRPVAPSLAELNNATARPAISSGRADLDGVGAVGDGYAKDMTKLTPTQRAKLPAREFGLPEKARTADAKKETGNYPMPDRGHAVSAKRLARKNRKAGNLTKDEFDRINRKADKILDD